MRTFDAYLHDTKYTWSIRRSAGTISKPVGLVGPLHSIFRGVLPLKADSAYKNAFPLIRAPDRVLKRSACSKDVSKLCQSKGPTRSNSFGGDVGISWRVLHPKAPIAVQSSVATVSSAGNYLYPISRCSRRVAIQMILALRFTRLTKCMNKARLIERGSLLK